MSDRTRRGLLHQTAGSALGLAAAGALADAQAQTSRNRRKHAKSDAMRLSLLEISDRLEIQDVLTRYCYAVDDRDWDAYRAVFTSDAVIDDTVTGGVRSSVEEHIVYMRRALSKILISQHALSTVLLDIRGNEANARAHCSCPMVVDLGRNRTQVFFQGLWYRNRLARTPKGWLISALVEEGYWNQNVPPGFRF